MRQLGGGVTLATVVLLLALAGCGAPAFDPTGSYTGTVTVSGGATDQAAATINATSVSGSWSWTLVVNSSTYTGTCTHDTSVSPDNLTCADAGNGIKGSFVGDLTGTTWSGTFSDDAPESGTFTLTR